MPETIKQSILKDDISLSSKVTFGVLAFLCFGVLVFCCFNIYRHLYRDKKYKNVFLSLFYLFAFITLTVRLLNFLDCVVDWDPNTYLVLVGLPCFTYLIAGHCQLANLAEMIVDQRFGGGRWSKKKLQMSTKVITFVLGLLILTCITIFAVSLVF